MDTEGAKLDLDEFARLFGGPGQELDGGDRSVLLRELKLRVVPEGEVLIAEGVPSREVLFVWEGQVAVHLRVDGRDVPVGRCGPGSVLGEVSFITGELPTATVVTTTRSTVLVATPAVYASLKRQHPRVAVALLRAINRALAQRVINATNRLQEAEARYQVQSMAPNRLPPVEAGLGSLAGDTPAISIRGRSILARLFGALFGAAEA